MKSVPPTSKNALDNGIWTKWRLWTTSVTTYPTPARDLCLTSEPCLSSGTAHMVAPRYDTFCGQFPQTSRHNCLGRECKYVSIVSNAPRPGRQVVVWTSWFMREGNSCLAITPLIHVMINCCSYTRHMASTWQAYIEPTCRNCRPQWWCGWIIQVSTTVYNHHHPYYI